MGRPKNYSTADIKNIIDMYISFTGGTVLLSASKIAGYAEKNLGLSSFKYYVINRNPETKKYIEDLNRNICDVAEKKITLAATSFTQIDVQKYKTMNKDELGIALANINTLLEDMVDSNTRLLKENIALKNVIREKELEIKKINDTVRKSALNSDESLKQLQNENDKQRKIINTLKQSEKQSSDIIHLLWDKEAEIIMKKTGVFINDGGESNPKRTITDIDDNVFSIIKDANTLECTNESENLHKKFMQRLKNI